MSFTFTLHELHLLHFHFEHLLFGLDLLLSSTSIWGLIRLHKNALLSFLHRFFFEIFGSPCELQKVRSAAEAGPPQSFLIKLIHNVNYVGSPGIPTYSLKGFFGEPAARSTSPSASTRPREFVLGGTLVGAIGGHSYVPIEGPLMAISVQ